MVKISAALALLIAAWSAPSRGVVFEPETAHVLRARRALPDLIDESAAQGIELNRVTADYAYLRTLLRPAPRAYQTVVIEAARELPVAVASTPTAAVALLARQLRPFVPAFADAAERRELLANRLREMVHAPDVARAEVTNLVRFALWSMDVTDVGHRVDHLDAGDLEVFADPKYLKARLGRLKAEFGASRRRDRGVVNYLNHVQKDLRPIARPAAAVERLILAELPPELAVFKGYLGRDCSTKFCFGTPLAPGERTFVILDEAERPRGYVGVSRVEIRDRSGYYVNTINGRRLNAAHTLMVVAGVKALLHDEITALTLPRARQLRAAVNFRVVRETLRTLIDDATEVTQTFPDAAERAIIEFEHRGSYETMVDNRVAELLAPELLARFRFPTTVYSGSHFAAPDPTAPTPAELNAAVVEAICAHAASFADVIWYRAGGDPGRLAEVTATLLNARFEPTAAYRARVAELLRELGLAPDFVTTHAGLFVAGRIVAAESMTPAERPRTIKALLTYLERRSEWTKRTPLVTWLSRLAPDALEDLIFATTRALYAAARTEAAARDQFQGAPRTQFTALLSHLTTLDQLIARAPEWAARSLDWGELAEASVHLAALEDDSTLVFAGRQSIELVNQAIFAAASASDVARIARQVLNAPGGHGFYGEVKRWIARFVELEPSDADVEAFVGGVREPATTRALIAWLRDEAPRDLAALVRSLDRHFPRPLDAYDRALIAPHLAARFEVVLRGPPAASELADFRARYLNDGSGLHAVFASPACADRLQSTGAP